MTARILRLRLRAAWGMTASHGPVAGGTCLVIRLAIARALRSYVGGFERSIMKASLSTLAIATSLAVAAPAIAASAPEVSVESGLLRGTQGDGVVAYKGIPFAAPPIGPLRWRAPQPAAAWSGTRDAGAYGPDCMQKPFPSDAAPLGTTPAEDCLYANVWRPATADRKLPVLVWIYGGGFVNGGASPPTYAGAALAKKGIVFVSFNYRLGRFGTFAFPALTQQHADARAIGNYGYMDQLAALRWIARNIAAFGGDPSRVTIVGESAGGVAVHALIASPLAAGLFARAVIQSGGPNALPSPTLAEAETIGANFARSKGIAPDDPQALAKLRALSADDIVGGLNLATSNGAQSDPRTYSAPIDQPQFPANATAAYAGGRFTHVAVMVGATSNDIGGADGMMIRGAALTASLLSAQHVPVYQYRFSYVAESARRPDTVGADHATDIPFFFDTEAIKYGAATTDRDRAAGALASGYLVNFVKTGDPNGAGLDHWPAYSDARPALLDLDASGTASVEPAPAPEHGMPSVSPAR